MDDLTVELIVIVHLWFACGYKYNAEDWECRMRCKMVTNECACVRHGVPTQMGENE